MKKAIGIVIFILILSGVLLLINSNKLITLGSTKYYIKTVNEYEDITTDPRYKTYEYKINGYDKNGNEKLVTFTANKVLKSDRYLMIYVKDDKAKSYEEVETSKLPTKVKEIYNEK
ncbi:hypothetical protein UT300007_32310 [Clostridium sp. CTA-7]